MIETLDGLLAAARGAGLALVADGATLDTTGLDFIVAHARDEAGTRWIVRSPRRADVIAAARHEAKVLATVRGRLGGVATPDWRVHSDELIAYPRLDGVPLVTLETGAPVWNKVDPAAPHDAYVESMAQLYTALQRVPVADLRAVTIADTRAKLASAIERSRGVLDPPAALVERWQRWLAGPTWPAHVSLGHGDLHPGHMLLDDAGRLCGVLDWTEAEVGDPAVDLAMFAGCFGRAPLERLVARMAELGARTWPGVVEHALERWAVMPALVAAWAVDHDHDAGALAHARWLLSTLVAA